MRDKNIKITTLVFSVIGVLIGGISLISQFVPALAEAQAPLKLFLASVGIMTATSFVSLMLYPQEKQPTKEYRLFFLIAAAIPGIIAVLQLSFPLWSNTAYRLRLISAPLTEVADYLAMLPGALLVLLIIVFAIQMNFSGRLLALEYLVAFSSGWLILYSSLGLFFIGIVALGYFVISDARKLQESLRHESSKELQPA